MVTLAIYLAGSEHMSLMAMHFPCSTQSLTCIWARRNALTNRPQYSVHLCSCQLYNVSCPKLTVKCHSVSKLLGCRFTIAKPQRKRMMLHMGSIIHAGSISEIAPVPIFRDLGLLPTQPRYTCRLLLYSCSK